jgi:hypothetical protein
VHRSDEVAHDYNGNDHSQNMVEDDLQLTRRVASTVGRPRNREDADDNPVIFSSITSYLCFII